MNSCITNIGMHFETIFLHTNTCKCTFVIHTSLMTDGHETQTPSLILSVSPYLSLSFLISFSHLITSGSNI